MATLPPTKVPAPVGERPTREQCIQEAGAVLARALHEYVNVPARADAAA